MAQCPSSRGGPRRKRMKPFSKVNHHTWRYLNSCVCVVSARAHFEFITFLPTTHHHHSPPPSSSFLSRRKIHFKFMMYLFKFLRIQRIQNAESDDDACSLDQKGVLLLAFKNQRYMRGREILCISYIRWDFKVKVST